MSGPFGYLEGVTAAINRFSEWNKIEAAVAPAQPVYENTETGQRIPTKELLVKDVLPELEQAADIKQRIETVRAKPVSVTTAPLQWYAGATALTTFRPGEIVTASSMNNVFSGLYSALAGIQAAQQLQGLQQQDVQSQWRR